MAENMKTTDSVGAGQDFVDVLFLANRDAVLPQIQQLLSEKNVSFRILPVDQFQQISHNLQLIGTIVIDAQGMTLDEQESLDKIIAILDTNHIATILLNNWLNFSQKKCSLLTTLHSSTIEELWGNISANLAYRKRTSAIYHNHDSNTEHKEQSKADRAEEIAEQLRMAGLVQRDFLPSKLPNTDKVNWTTIFRPADSVSGDIYDIARLDEKHIGFYIADVVGHSMPAALLTMFIKQALVMRETRNNKYRIFEPIEVIANLNAKMAQQNLSGCQFATCCYCLLNTETLQLTFARAGHPYPILIRPGQQPQQLQIRGPLLGIFEQAEFTQQTIQLRSGDKLFMYSDGADPLVGEIDDLSRFNFSEEFCDCIDLPIHEMIKEFDGMLAKRQINPAEVDDVTAIGMQIS